MDEDYADDDYADSCDYDDFGDCVCKYYWCYYGYDYDDDCDCYCGACYPDSYDADDND